MGYIGKVKDTAGNTQLVGSTLYGTCSTAAATAAKVVTCPDFVELVEGVTIHVKFTYSNTASNATMKVANTDAKNLCSYGTTRVGTTEKTSWKAGAVVSFTYDGTSWVMNDYIADTGVTTDTKNTAGIDSSTSKMYLVGSTTAPTSGTNGTARTYANSNVYATNGILFADAFNDIQLNKNQSVSGFTIHYGMSAINLSEDGIEIVYGLNAGTPRTGLGVSDGNVYTLAAACEKGVDSSISAGSTSTNLPTTQAVVEYIAGQAAGAATFQGTLVQTDSGSSPTRWTQAELEAASYKSGWYWVVETAGTYAGNVMEVGDMLFCVSDKSGSTYAAADFAAIQNNIETLTNPEITTIWTNAVPVS